tara:strand:- start:88 stop:306 length:219 start_codon:yes stop_codon:yes gene_type:complete
METGNIRANTLLWSKVLQTIPHDIAVDTNERNEIAIPVMDRSLANISKTRVNNGINPMTIRTKDITSSKLRR